MRSSAFLLAAVSLCGCSARPEEASREAIAALGTDASGGSSAPPARLVQHVSGSNLRANSLSTPYCYYLQLPAPASAGNAIVVGATWKGSATLSVSDDQPSDVYATNLAHFDSTDNQSIGVASAFHVTAGARTVSVCFNADPGGWVQPMVSEFADVVGVDGAGSGAHGVSATATAGTLTPTGSDALYQVAYAPSTVGISPVVTPGSGDTLLSADLLDGWSAQYGPGTTGAPSLSIGTSLHWLTAAVLLKQGSAGVVPAGMRIVRSDHLNLPSSVAAGGTGNSILPNPVKVEFPSSGNLLVAAIGSGNGTPEPPQATGITDGNGNRWVNAKTVINGDAVAQLFYAGNATGGPSLPLSLAWTSTGTDATALLYDVAGASPSPLDVAVGGSGQAGLGNLTLPFTITPASAGELVIVATPWDFDTAGGLIGGLLDTQTTSGEAESGPWPVDENNGWGHVVSTSTSPITFTWVPLFHEIEFGIYSATAAAFKPNIPIAARAVSTRSLSGLALLLAIAGVVAQSASSPRRRR
jgi:hypothetical protein